MEKKKAKSSPNNPNKANQHKPDPRQKLFLQYYLDPKSETFANALQSGLKAGYELEYSKTILSQDLTWLSESLRDEDLLKKAEENLKDVLEMDDYLVNEEGVKVKRIDHVKVKLDASKFVASRLGKDKWSDRTEHTGKDGKDLFTTNDKDKEKTNKAVKDALS